MKKIFILLFLLITVNAYPSTYYIDATSGNNSNDGLTAGAPWQTIVKVNATSFNPGDTISFKCGETWSETLEIPSSGNSGNHITFNSYDSGARPIIEGDGSEYWSVVSHQKQYLTFNGIHFGYTRDAAPNEDDTTATVYISGIYDAQGECYNIWFNDCKFSNTIDRNIYLLKIKNTTNYKIENCIFEGGWSAMSIGSSIGSWGDNVMYGLIDNCTISGQDDGDVDECDGIRLGNVNSTGTIISNNTFYDWQEDAIDFLSNGGTVIIENNIFRDPGDDYTDTACIKTADITFSPSNPKAIIRNNLFYNINVTEGNANIILLSSGDYTNEVYNNIAYNYDAHGINSSSGGAKIYNNVFIGGERGILIQGRSGGNSTVTTTIRNNILSGTEFDFRVADYTGTDTVTVTGGYNCLVNDASVEVSGVGATYNGSADDLYATDPLFNVSGYELDSDSPCINTGVSLAGTVDNDYRGFPRPIGAGYDIGAYEIGTSLNDATLYGATIY